LSDTQPQINAVGAGRTGHTTTAARDRRLMPAETIRPPAHGRRVPNSRCPRTP